MQFSLLPGCPGQELRRSGAYKGLGFSIFYLFIYLDKEKREGGGGGWVSLTVALNLIFGDRVSHGTQISTGCLEASDLPVSAVAALVLQSLCGHAWLLHRCQRSELWILLAHGTVALASKFSIFFFIFSTLAV